MKENTHKLIDFLVSGGYTEKQPYKFNDATITFKVKSQNDNNTISSYPYSFRSIFFEKYNKINGGYNEFGFEHNGKIYVVWVEYENKFGFNLVNLINYEDCVDEILEQIKELA